ncbi:hypothetical protein DEO72_LG7g1382 [Vigna unguiculata]|uniref:Uncharacterized protein n=1 Tax=Vigna unguiculata TaxID=3917 RepID=A0A4D6MFF4_VIGUN|nr:hypothetical protein DEO72_LG7g1382 [Vigna unguiculata]
MLRIIHRNASTLIPATLANPSHNSRFLVFVRHPEPQLKRCYSEQQLKEYHVLNPYPEPQLKGYVPSHNSRNSNNLTSKALPEAFSPEQLPSTSSFAPTTRRNSSHAVALTPENATTIYYDAFRCHQRCIELGPASMIHGTTASLTSDHRLRSRVAGTTAALVHLRHASSSDLKLPCHHEPATISFIAPLSSFLPRSSRYHHHGNTTRARGLPISSPQLARTAATTTGNTRANAYPHLCSRLTLFLAMSTMETTIYSVQFHQHRSAVESAPPLVARTRSTTPPLGRTASHCLC